MSRLFLHILLVIATCLPLVLVVTDMTRRYPLNGALIDIGLVDAVLLIAALALPLYALSRFGVKWRAGPDEY